MEDILGSRIGSCERAIENVKVCMEKYKERIAEFREGKAKEDRVLNAELYKRLLELANDKLERYKKAQKEDKRVQKELKQHQ